MSYLPDPSIGHGLRAFGDESLSNRVLDPDVYILAAALVTDKNLPLVRAQAEGLILPGQHKAHWRDDNPKRHDAAIETIVAMPVQSLAVVRRGSSNESEERRRRKCLERFVFELEQRGCVHLTLESRGRAGDQRDRNLLDAMRARNHSSIVRLDHAPGPSDPVLWVADALCGAVVAARTGEPRWLARLGRRLETIVVDAVHE